MLFSSQIEGSTTQLHSKNIKNNYSENHSLNIDSCWSNLK